MLTLGGKPLPVPILQGGMGVGVSLGGLAGAVAACGGMGCISTADAGYREPDFARDPAAANHRALTAEIQKAKAIAGGMGLVAINAMVATRDYADAIRTAVAAGVDAVVSGAGLPLELPGIVGTGEVAIAPIVSSARAAKLILRRWAKGFDRTADFVVIEGCKAGGHLGFAEADAGRPLPVFGRNSAGSAGRGTALRGAVRPRHPGICGGRHLHRGRHGPLYKAGRRGRAACHPLYPHLRVRCHPDLQGRAAGRKAGGCAHHPQPGGNARPGAEHPAGAGAGRGQTLPAPALRPLSQDLRPAEVPCCITHALIEAVKGNVEEGLFFCGDNVGRLDRMHTVRELMDELVTEWRQNL